MLQRALEVRRAFLFHETTGAIFDSLAQIHLIHGDYDAAKSRSAKAREAYGDYGAQTPRWYDWSLRLIEAKLAARRGQFARAVDLAEAIARRPACRRPTSCSRISSLSDALVAAGPARRGRRAHRAVAAKVDPRTTPGVWGEFLRVRGAVAAERAAAQRGVSRPRAECERVRPAGRALPDGSQSARAGTPGRACRRALAGRALPATAGATFSELGAVRDLEDVEAARALTCEPGTGEFVGSPADADDAIVRRLVDAAALPELLARETRGGAARDVTSRHRRSCSSAAATSRVHRLDGLRCRRSQVDRPSSLARSAAIGAWLLDGALGADREGPRVASRSRWPRPPGHLAERRLRMIGAVARQGFELCEARERPVPSAMRWPIERPSSR